MSIGKRKRFAILKRDGFRCRYCGAFPTVGALRVDHIHPRAEGGGDEPENLITSCFDCNAGKADVLLEQDVKASDDDAADWIGNALHSARVDTDAARCAVLGFGVRAVGHRDEPAILYLGQSALDFASVADESALESRGADSQWLSLGSAIRAAKAAATAFAFASVVERKLTAIGDARDAWASLEGVA